MSATFAILFAQVSNAAAAASTTPSPDANASGAGGSGWSSVVIFIALLGAFYFALIRPQMESKKKQEETIKSAKTGDKVVTSSGIHGYITNVKETTVIVKVHDNVKLEIEKSHIDKITRPDSSGSDSDKTVATKS